MAALFPNRSLSSTAAPPPLRYLNLEGNSLGPKGTAALVEGMLAATAPPKLIRLDLAQNRLRNEGATAIARLFTEWKGAGGYVRMTCLWVRFAGVPIRRIDFHRKNKTHMNQQVPDQEARPDLKPHQRRGRSNAWSRHLCNTGATKAPFGLFGIVV